MEITRSYLSNYYATSMYMAASSALSSAYQSGGNNNHSSSAPASSFQTDPASMPARRPDRSDPASPNLSINIPGSDGGGVLDRSGGVTRSNSVLAPEVSADGLPDRPELLFTRLANGLSDRSAQMISQNLEKAQGFSEELRSDALNMRDILQNVSQNINQAVTEQTSNGNVSDETSDRLANAANRLADQYNATMNTLANAPNQSRQVAAIERNMEAAVTNNMEDLNRIGFTQNDDGTLAFDENRFRQALQEDPQSVQNVLGQESDFTSEVNRAMDTAENTRITRNAEFSASFSSANSFMTYPSAVQSSSMVSMLNIPAGSFINRLA